MKSTKSIFKTIKDNLKQLLDLYTADEMMELLGYKRMANDYSFVRYEKTEEISNTFRTKTIEITPSHKPTALIECYVKYDAGGNHLTHITAREAKACLCKIMELNGNI